MTVVEPIALSIFTPSDADEVTRLVAQAFIERDPPSVAIGLTSAEFEKVMRLICPLAAAEGLSIVARSMATGEVCGAILAKDLASMPPEGLLYVTMKLLPVFLLLNELHEEYAPGSEPKSGEAMHLFSLGVARKFVRQGIAKRLVVECLANGARKGYPKAITEATSKTSQHIGRQQGFVERVRGSYADYRFMGKAVFASIADQGGPILMDKRLGDGL